MLLRLSLLSTFLNNRQFVMMHIVNSVLRYVSSITVNDDKYNELLQAI